jgi:hypothetical protein
MTAVSEGKFIVSMPNLTQDLVIGDWFFKVQMCFYENNWVDNLTVMAKSLWSGVLTICLS